MVNFDFYQTAYQGGTIQTEGEFRELEREAAAQLRSYKRIYTVRSRCRDSEKMAVCAMCDSLYGFQLAQSGGGAVSSARIGSVSTTFKAADVDVSAKAQSRELLRCAGLYLDIYRGVG